MIKIKKLKKLIVSIGISLSLLVSTAALSPQKSVAAFSIPVKPDHIVIVIEENHSKAQITGNSQAPYINSLMKQGANFTNMFGITHPSQPNYIALFSGSTQGVTTNDLITRKFSGDNLGNKLLQRGILLLDIHRVCHLMDTKGLKMGHIEPSIIHGGTFRICRHQPIKHLTASLVIITIYPQSQL